MFKHVPTVAILLILQGALEICAGFCALLYASVYGVFALIPLSEEIPIDGEGPDAEVLAAILGGMGLIFMLIAFVLIAFGVLKIAAGIYNLRYRKHTLGLIALLTGLGSVMTCYCAPTGIALAVYGLFVYLHPTVKQAFVLGEQGMSNDDVLRSLLNPARGQPNAQDL